MMISLPPPPTLPPHSMIFVFELNKSLVPLPPTPRATETVRARSIDFINRLELLVLVNHSLLIQQFLEPLDSSLLLSSVRQPLTSQWVGIISWQLFEETLQTRQWSSQLLRAA
jgi:hypothetical protein